MQMCTSAHTQKEREREEREIKATGENLKTAFINLFKLAFIDIYGSCLKVYVFAQICRAREKIKYLAFLNVHNISPFHFPINF